jgi:hypothetical protein
MDENRRSRFRPDFDKINSIAGWVSLEASPLLAWGREFDIKKPLN